MKENKKNTWLCVGAVAGFFFMGVSFGLMPLDEPEISWWRFVPGGLFWGCAAIGIVCSILLTVRCKNLPKGKRPAVLTFFSNPAACVADIAMFAGIVALILLIFFRGTGDIFCFSSIGISVFAFCLHCLFNSAYGKSLFPDKKSVSHVSSEPKKDDVKKNMKNAGKAPAKGQPPKKAAGKGKN